MDEVMNSKGTAAVKESKPSLCFWLCYYPLALLICYFGIVFSLIGPIAWVSKGVGILSIPVSWSYYENSDEMQHHQEEVVIIKASGGVCVSK